MADLTFLMNSTRRGPNQFCTLAKQYFVAAGSTVIDALPTARRWRVFTGSSRGGRGTINPVSHASAFAAMICR
jgi:hypothetical protein